MGDKMFDSNEKTLLGITLKIRKMELAWQVIPLLVKTTEWIEFALETGLVVCFRDHIEDGEMQVPFEQSFTVKVRNRWSLIFILKKLSI